MDAAQNEPTVRIQRDELMRLLDTMTPPQLQTITTRSPVVGRNTNAQKAALIVAPTRITRPVPLLRAKTNPGAPAKSVVVPEVPEWTAPPRIEMADEVSAIHSAPPDDHGHAIAVTPHVPELGMPRYVTLAATASFLVICAAFLLT